MRTSSLACLGTANYFFSVPLMTLVAGSGAVSLIWPKWVKRHIPEKSRPGPNSPDWMHRLAGLVIIVIALGFMAVAVHEARTDPNCTAAFLGG